MMMTPNRYLLFISFITVIKLEAKILVLFHLDRNCMIVGANHATIMHAISNNLYVNCVTWQDKTLVMAISIVVIILRF